MARQAAKGNPMARGGSDIASNDGYPEFVGTTAVCFTLGANVCVSRIAGLAVWLATAALHANQVIGLSINFAAASSNQCAGQLIYFQWGHFLVSWCCWPYPSTLPGPTASSIDAKAGSVYFNGFWAHSGCSFLGVLRLFWVLFSGSRVWKWRGCCCADLGADLVAELLNTV